MGAWVQGYRSDSSSPEIIWMDEPPVHLLKAVLTPMKLFPLLNMSMVVRTPLKQNHAQGRKKEVLPSKDG